MKRVDALLKWATAELVHSPSARLDAEILLAFILQKNRSFFFAWPEFEVTGEQAAQFTALIAQRKQGMPVAYLTGEQGFWSLTLQVNDSTLIPRPETELLVEAALECEKPVARVLDLGTGSGAIALAIARERPAWQVEGVDMIAEAVALAERNALQNQIPNVSFRPSFWFDCVQAQYDVIVSNPPYIDTCDPHLAEGDVRFEPRSALVAAEAGVADLRLIIQRAPAFLFKGGWLWLEHGWQQAEAVRNLLTAAGFEAIQSRHDLAGHERISGGRR